jgi:Sporulation protein Cse60
MRFKPTKTKLFTGFYEGTGKDRRFVDVDEEMNRFLNNAVGIEVIDIKFTSCAISNDGEIWHSALLIYKEV